MPSTPVPRFALFATALALGWGIARADSLVPTGQPAPPIELPSLAGETVRLTDHRGNVVILLFGELYNDNSVAACGDIAAAVGKFASSRTKPEAFLIVTQNASPAELSVEARRKNVQLPILHDADRRVFAAYHVTVLPSLVIVGGDGETLLPCAGYPLDFADMVDDTLAFATGQLSEQEFRARRTAAKSSPQSETHVRALRLAMLGEQLARRGSFDLAIGKFTEAIGLDPSCASAQIGMGACLLRHGDLAEAERCFERGLAAEPDSVDAALGLIRIQTLRGGDELRAAHERLRDLVRKRPNDPRILYMLGMAAEQSGDVNSALGYYKKAAESALYGQQGESQ